jgi:imidazole glycerol-phosphate synthase subunit HisH
MNVLVFDYGTGNLHSLGKALEAHGARVRAGTAIEDAHALVLPGVGAFGAAAHRLAPYREAIRDAAAGGLPVLGICLGMQLLLDSSTEGAGAGLGLIPGTVRRLEAARVPHMGWNQVVRPASPTRSSPDPLLDGVEGERFYFANSYVVEPDDRAATIGVAHHERGVFPAAIRAGSVAGTQFHPEKSGAAGLRLIRNFLEDAG